MNGRREGVVVVSDPQFGLKLTDRASLISTERVRVRTVILLCPLTSQVLIGRTFGPKRVTDELANVCGGRRGCVYASLLTGHSLFRLSFRWGRKRLVRKEWREQDPWVPWPPSPLTVTCNCI